MALDDNVSKMIERGNGQGGGIQSPPVGGDGNGWSLFLGIVEMILVLGLLAAVIFLLIKFLAVKTNPGRVYPMMRTISVHPLTSNRTIHMVSLEDRVYVVGVGEEVTLLEVIKDQELVERLKNQSAVVGSPDLPAWLPKWLPIQKKSEVEEDTESLPFYETLQSKLQQMKDQRKKIRKWDSDENE
ncbi:flagellar biosynthetic protein FliO [Effusibacillus consociatus]|uniref:Flagellar biosynthetic protein FliO n=1 Tax=Effusibacillus consociatus TaxID=1117041 RepID=A0ABV9Q6A9_9BACL